MEVKINGISIFATVKGHSSDDEAKEKLEEVVKKTNLPKFLEDVFQFEIDNIEVEDGDEEEKILLLSFAKAEND